VRSVLSALAILALAMTGTSADGATFVVTTDADSGPGSLREAITLANANAEADEIVFDADYTISPETMLPLIRSEITISGTGWGRTILDGTNTGTTYPDHVLAVWPNGSLVLDAVTVRNSGGASAIYAGGELLVTNSLLDNNFGEYGGAIGVQWDGDVTVRASTFTNNQSIGVGGAIGVISGSLDVATCTFTGNEAAVYGFHGGGGGIGCLQSQGQLAISNSTFSGNQSDTVGGALFIESCGASLLVAVTITGNTATTGANGVEVRGSTVLLSNSIIDNDCVFDLGGAIVSQGHNLERWDTCGLVPALGDLVKVDPLLGPLEDHGGPTATHLLLPCSPAIDAGATTCGLATDQRGFPRPVDGNGDGTVACDIGAVEVQGMLFADDFESGGTTAWSVTVP